MNKSFRGLVADGDIQRIRLSTNNGLIGYRIVKLEAIPQNPFTANSENAVTVFSTQTNATGAVRTPSIVLDFSDPTLLAAAIVDNSDSYNYSTDPLVIFDNVKFNQDIFICNASSTGSESINYHLELEQVKLSNDEAAIATLKDMRAGPDTNFGP